MLLLENVRYEEGETANEPGSSPCAWRSSPTFTSTTPSALPTGAGAYAEGVAHLLPSAAGRLTSARCGTLTGILEHPARPLVAIVGGSKVADKIAVIDRFLQVAPMW